MRNTLIILFSYFLLQPIYQAQSIGPYSGIYHTNHENYSGVGVEEFYIGPVYGVQGDIFQKNWFRLSVDAFYYGKKYSGAGERNQDHIVGRDTSYIKAQTAYDIRYGVSGISFMPYLANDLDDTFGFAVGPKIGLYYFNQKAYFDNPVFIDVNNSYFIPGLGASGKIYRNYFLKMPLQVFVLLEVNWLPTTIVDNGRIIDGIIYYRPLVSGYAKLGLAYTFQ